MSRYALRPLANGCHELAVDGGPVLVLDEDEGRRLGIALADVLTALDAPGVAPFPVTLELARSRVTIAGSGEGVRITIDG